MPCIVNNLVNLGYLSQCQWSIGGLKKIWLAPFSSEIFSQLTIDQNQVIGINAGLVFTELEFNNLGTKYSDSYNPLTSAYEYNLDVEITRVNYEKRQAIDALVKNKFVIIYQDKNGQYYLLGEKSGMTTTTYNSTTDVYLNKSIYTFRFSGKADYLPFGVSSDLIDSLTSIDCSVLNDELALSSPIFWSPYSNCIVSDLPGYISPL